MTSVPPMDDLDGPVRRALHDARLDLSLEFRRGGRGDERSPPDHGHERSDDRPRAAGEPIPIDPPGLGVRQTDAGARAFVGGSRASSVFPTPPRAALEARTFAEANEIARTITGKGISQQAFALGKKILEVHALAEVDERVIEMHPEVSFRELAGQPLLESKHTTDGLARRRDLLAAAGIVLPGAVPGVPEVDLLDAAAGAWTAARYADRRAHAFPPEHTERLGAIWR